MAAYATVPPDDSFAASKAMFTALAGELAGPAAAGLTACELEEFIDEESRNAVRQLLQDHYDLRALREEQRAGKHPAPVAGTDGITRTRLETGHARHLATLFGTVTVTRCAWRKPGAPDYLPADAALSMPAGRHSHTLAKLAALEAARPVLTRLRLVASKGPGTAGILERLAAHELDSPVESEPASVEVVDATHPRT